MEEPIVKHCSMDGKLIKPCTILAKATSDYQGHYKKGLSIMPITQLTDDENGKKTFVHTKDYLIVKNGEYQKKGIVCAYCPFCGSKVLAEVEK